MNKANQSKKQEKKYWIPLEVTDETIRDFGIDLEKVTWKLIGNKKYRVVMVKANEAVFEAYMEPLWAESKRNSRDSRCFIRGKSGKLVRCPESNKCEECNIYNDINMEENRTASLSALEEAGQEPVAEGSFEDDVIYETIFKDLLNYLSEIDPVLGNIFHMLYDQYTQKEIAEELGMKPRTISDCVKKIREILQPMAKDMFDR